MTNDPEVVEVMEIKQGKTAAKLLIGLNVVVIVVLIVLLRDYADNILLWFVLVELLFVVFIVVPVFSYQLIVKRAHFKLAAARSVSWLLDAVRQLSPP